MTEPAGASRPPRWCRWFGHALFVGRCVRCGYVKPFVVGKVRRAEEVERG